MPTCERSPDGEHHYYFGDITFSDGARTDHYICAYCERRRSISMGKPPDRNKLMFPTDADLDKK